MDFNQKYEMIVGLETHVELKTESKIFCSCSTAFGAPPNTQVCPVCAGMPGSLPVLNQKAVDFAILAGLATNCSISHYSKFDRKNYFYPDLPKAYQISQHDIPLCQNGYITVGEQNNIKIGIVRIHLEEDAGKLMHHEHGTQVDLNRCGVPLIEIVSAPDIRSPRQAKEYLQKLRSIMMYLGISDCKMNEGSLRCDINISVRKKGDRGFNSRCEIKNVNSFSFAVKALQYEFERQCKIMEQGGRVEQQTLRFDQPSGTTVVMRTKEEADDYRYFPEPDIPPITVDKAHINRLKSLIPMLPDERIAIYTGTYGIKNANAAMIAADKNVADYFQACLALCSDAQELSNLLTVEVFRLMQDCAYINISPKRLAQVVNMVSSQAINRSTAKKLITLLWQGDFDAEKFVKDNNLEQINDRAIITDLCKRAIADNQKACADYKNGKSAALKAIVGKAIALSKGNANPALAEKITIELLNEQQ